jgi:hypothetical protein
MKLFFTRSQKVKASAIAVLAVGLILAFDKNASGLLAVGENTSRPSGTVLSESDLDAVFGDAPTLECLNDTTYKCSDGFTSGVGGCLKCTSATGRAVCCSTSQQLKTCNWNGTGVCTNENAFTGTANGNPGSCGTCTVATWTQNGMCTALVNATGTQCMRTPRPGVQIEQCLNINSTTEASIP